MLCVDCSYKQRSKTQSLSYDALKAEIEAKGSLLLTSHDVKLNTHTELSLICTYCGDEFTLRYGDYKRGRNKNLRCVKCSHIVNGKYLAKNLNRISHETFRSNAYQTIKTTVESLGAELLTPYEDYVDQYTYIRFRCSKCKSEEHQIRWKKFLEGQNPELLCSHCLPEKMTYTTEIVKD